MGVTDVPQWLPAAFVRSVLAVGATAPREEIEVTCRRLLDRWQAADRHFHNLRHLIDVLARVDELAEETHHPDTVRLAAWYHGAVFSSVARKAYSRSGGEDEEASAELATAELGALGVPERVTARIGELILNLKRHEASRRDIDCLALCDADLAVLASEPQKYQAYRKAVREEYAHLPARHYVEARTAIVTKLLNRRDIFVSPMGAQWEDAARENLSAELDRLHAEHARLGEAGPEDSVAAAEAAQGEIAQEEPRADDGDTSVPHTFASAPPSSLPSWAGHGTPSSAGNRAPRREGAAATAQGDEVGDDAPATGEPAAEAASETPASEPAGETPDFELAAGTRAFEPAGETRGSESAFRTYEPTAGTRTSGPAFGSPSSGRAASRTTGRSSSLEALPEELDAPRRRSDDEATSDREEIARSSRERIEAAVRLGRERAERERRQRERLAAARAERADAMGVRDRRTGQGDGVNSARTADSSLSARTAESTVSARTTDSSASARTTESTVSARTAGSPVSAQTADSPASARTADSPVSPGAGAWPASAPSSVTPREAVTGASPAEAAGSHLPLEHRPAVDDVPRMIEPDPLTGARTHVDDAPLHGIEREPDYDRPRRKDRKDRKGRKKGRAER